MLSFKDYLIIGLVTIIVVIIVVHLIKRIKNKKYCFSHCESCPFKDGCKKKNT